MFLSWYTARYRKSKVGTVAATIHFGILFLVLVGIGIHPGNDWPWWQLVPFFLDFPLSLPLKLLFSGITGLVARLPHAGLDWWLSSLREPFSSFDLFWLPAVGYLVLGTIWYYYIGRGLARLDRLLKDRDRRRALRRASSL